LEVLVGGLTQQQPATKDREVREVAMPLADVLKPQAEPLYNELQDRYRASRPGVDFFFYNVGTGIALFTAGAATVMATVEPLSAAILSSISAFFIAMTRLLNFGARWTRQLDRQARYAAMIYDLNSIPLREPDATKWSPLILNVWERMTEERLRDGQVPGTDSGHSEAQSTAGANN
jgi:hypothetical protein